jgi:hypothetical protein
MYSALAGTRDTELTLRSRTAGLPDEPGERVGRVALVAGKYVGVDRHGDDRAGRGSRLNIELLTDEFDVTRTTAAKALRLLEADGRVLLCQGVGWYVTGPPPQGDEGS